MGISVEGEGNACVPQLFGYNLGGNACAERQSCRCVAQIVEPDARQLRALENDLEVPLHEIPFIHWVAVRVHEDQIRRSNITNACGAFWGLGVTIIGEELEDRPLKLH